MKWQIPESVPLERTINELMGWRAEPLVPANQLRGMMTLCEQGRSLRLRELNGDMIRLLVSQRTSDPWTLRLALALLAHDPLVSYTYFDGDLLLSLFSECPQYWAANPLEGEIIRRACARISQRAGDPDEVISENADQAVEYFVERGYWPWSPPPELDAPERWRMPDAAPLERSIEQLAGRGLEPMRQESLVTARLRPALARPIGELTREQVRFLLEEHYGLPWLLPLALRWVEEDPLELTARHPGETLIALLDLRFAVVWRTNPDLIARLRAVLAGLEAAATDSDPLRSQGPLALLQRLEDRRLYPWSPSPLD